MSRTQIVDTVDEAVANIEDGSTVLVGGFAGDLTNWSTGAEGGIPAVGGAMDLAIGARDVYVMMTLFDKKGRPKLVPEYTLPLTGLGCVSRIYTDLAVIDVGATGAVVRETFGTTVAELSERLGVPLSEGASL